MRRGYIAFFAAVVILIGHLGSIACIFFLQSRMNFDERIDVSLIICPITAAYFISVTTFVIANMRNKIAVKDDTVNILYVIFATVIIVGFISSIYIIIFSYDQYKIIDIDNLKRSVGVLETVLGASFALIMESLFGSIKSNPVAPAG